MRLISISSIVFLTEGNEAMRIGISLLFAMALFASVSPTRAQEAAVPKFYHDLYQSLDSKLTLAAHHRRVKTKFNSLKNQESETVSY